MMNFFKSIEFSTRLLIQKKNKNNKKMETKEELIAKIQKQEEKIKKDKNAVKKSFNIAKQKLEESREQTEKIRNMELDTVLEGMEGEIVDEVRKLCLEAKQLENECLQLEEKAKRNTQNGSIISKNQKDFEGQLRQILGVQATDEIMKEIDRLSEYPQIVQDLKAQLIEAQESAKSRTGSQTTSSDPQNKSPIEQSIEEMMEKIIPLVEESKTKNKRIHQIVSTIYNTLHRILNDPENEFYAAHARSAVIQARGYGFKEPDFKRETTNNTNVPDPRDYD